MKPVKHIITIMFDSLRRDFLSCYGNTWIRTPNWQKLAQSSVLFDKAYLHSFATIPARHDIWNGRYTSAYRDWGPLPEEDIILSETLRRAGFTTMLIADCLNLFRDGYRFDRGFDGFHWIRGQVSDRYNTDPIDVDLGPLAEIAWNVDAQLVPYLRSVKDRRYEEEYFPAQVFRDASRWLEKNYKRERFYLHVECFDPHEPWDSPAYYVDHYDPGYEGRVIYQPPYMPWEGLLTEREVQHCRALYAGEVSLVDRWLGHFLALVEGLGLLENTAIIMMSDHGFYLGEHGWLGKFVVGKHGLNQHVQLYEEVAHLPLLIHVPGLKPGRNDDLVQLVDVGPTVLDLAGVPVPPSMQGRSWLPLLAGEQGVLREFAWSGTALQVPGRYRPSTVTTSDGWCLIHNGRVQPPPPGQRQWMVPNRLEEEILPAHLPPSELYYLPEDPRQERNLIADRPDVARSLHRQYLGFLEELGVPEAALSPRREL